MNVGGGGGNAWTPSGKARSTFAQELADESGAPTDSAAFCPAFDGIVRNGGTTADDDVAVVAVVVDDWGRFESASRPVLLMSGGVGIDSESLRILIIGEIDGDCEKPPSLFCEGNGCI